MTPFTTIGSAKSGSAAEGEGPNDDLGLAPDDDDDAGDDGPAVLLHAVAPPVTNATAPSLATGAGATAGAGGQVALDQDEAPGATPGAATADAGTPAAAAGRDATAEADVVPARRGPPPLRKASTFLKLSVLLPAPPPPPPPPPPTSSAVQPDGGEVAAVVSEEKEKELLHTFLQSRHVVVFGNHACKKCKISYSNLWVHRGLCSECEYVQLLRLGPFFMFGARSLCFLAPSRSPAPPNKVEVKGRDIVQCVACVLSV